MLQYRKYLLGEIGALEGEIIRQKYKVNRPVPGYKVFLCDDLTTSKPVALKFTDDASKNELECQIYRKLNAESPGSAPRLLCTFVDDAVDGSRRPADDAMLGAKHVLVLDQGSSVDLASSEIASTDLLQRLAASTILKCVNALHEVTGMVHRDLKPDNFMLFGALIRLIDFDRAVNEFSSDAGSVFSRQYVSPEVAFAQAGLQLGSCDEHDASDYRTFTITRALDVWSCGSNASFNPQISPRLRFGCALTARMVDCTRVRSGLILHKVFTGEDLFDGDLLEILQEAGTAEKVDQLVQNKLASSEAKYSAGKNSDARWIVGSMLQAVPAKRANLGELLHKRFFQPSISTQGLKSIQLLAVFCSPTHHVDSHGGILLLGARQRLNLEREMREMINSVPFSAGRELQPAARVEDVEEVLQGKNKALGLSPRILHFSGHGEKFPGYLGSPVGYLGFLRDTAEGQVSELLDAKKLTGLVQSISVKGELKCIFLVHARRSSNPDPTCFLLRSLTSPAVVLSLREELLPRVADLGRRIARRFPSRQHHRLQHFGRRQGGHVFHLRLLQPHWQGD